jgi:hypothetical protein
MAVLQIPVTSYPDQTLSVTLEGVLITLRIRWNERATSWFMDVSDDAGEPILLSRRIMVDWPILVGAVCNDTRIPPGTFWAQDTSGNSIDPLADDLGTRVLLLYIESS